MKISSRLCRWLLLKIGLNPDLEVKLKVEMTAVRRINKGILIEHQDWLGTDLDWTVSYPTHCPRSLRQDLSPSQRAEDFQEEDPRQEEDS